MAIVIYDLGEAENVVIMKDSCSDHGGVNGPKSVAIVHERFVAKGRDWKAFLLVARHDPSEKELVRNETGIDFPSIRIGIGVLVA